MASFDGTITTVTSDNSDLGESANFPVPITSSGGNLAATIITTQFVSGNPGRIQRLIRGNSGTKIANNLYELIDHDWTREVKQTEAVTIGGNYATRHDGSVVTNYELPGSGKLTYNGNIRTFALGSKSITTTGESVALNTGTSTGTKGDEEHLTVRFGDDTITVHADNDVTTLTDGESIQIFFGDVRTTSSLGATTSIVAGAHFEDHLQWTGHEDPTDELNKLAADTTYLQTELTNVENHYGAISGAPDDPGQVQADLNKISVSNRPQTSAHAQTKVIVNGLNANIKATCELNTSVARTAVGVFGTSLRCVHAFTNGVFAAGNALRAGVTGLWSKVAGMLDLNIGTNIGPPRLVPAEIELEEAQHTLKAMAAALTPDLANVGARMGAEAIVDSAEDAVDAAALARDIEVDVFQDMESAADDAATQVIETAQAADDAGQAILDGQQAITQAQGEVSTLEQDVSELEDDFNQYLDRDPPDEEAAQQVLDMLDYYWRELQLAQNNLSDLTADQAQLQADEVAAQQAAAAARTNATAADLAVARADNELVQAQTSLVEAETKLTEAQEALDDAITRAPDSAYTQEAQQAYQQAFANKQAAQAAVDAAKQSVLDNGGSLNQAHVISNHGANLPADGSGAGNSSGDNYDPSSEPEIADDGQ